MASTRSPLVSLIRSFMVIAGMTENRSACAPTQSKTRSGTSRLRAVGPGAGPHHGQELVDAGPRLGAAVEAAPVQPHPAGQLIAGVDGHQEVLDAAVGPAHQGRLDIRLRRAQQRVLLS